MSPAKRPPGFTDWEWHHAMQQWTAEPTECGRCGRMGHAFWLVPFEDGRMAPARRWCRPSCPMEITTEPQSWHGDPGGWSAKIRAGRAGFN